MESKVLYLEANIEVHEETAARKEGAYKVIKLPEGDDKQPDLLYFSAIFVSSGKNLNHAYFLGSELVAAEGSIINKALDVEHDEDEIIGHIYERVFIDKEGKHLDAAELVSRETASLDEQDMHIAIAGIIYKNRFPNVASEVASDKFKVSMECYYQGYDIKVGDLILNVKDAEALGLAAQDDKLLGRLAKVLKNGKEIAEGNIARVLRGICFSGCGIVKNPANPSSVIMETAKEKEVNIDNLESDDVIVLDYDKLQLQEESNKVTSKKVDIIKNIEGVCDVDNSNYLCDQDVRIFAEEAFYKRMEERAKLDKRKALLNDLKAALREAVET